MKDEDKKPGPDPDHLEIDDDWESAVKKTLEKKRPADGWPDKKSKKKRKRKPRK